MKRPHIVIFNPDQWRGDMLGHAGNAAAHTPTLDALVERDAVSFTSTFCQNPVCTPSRCSFMTGRYPHTNGHRTMFHLLQPHEPMLLKTLKNLGYYVWWGGKNDVAAPQTGYDAYCDVKYEPPTERMRPNLHSYHDWRGKPDEPDYYSHYYGKLANEDENDFIFDYDQAILEGALAAVHKYDERSSEQPLCLCLTLRHPHPPYIVEDPWYSLINPDKLPPRPPTPDWNQKPDILGGIYRLQHLNHWDEARWRDLRRTYYGMGARVDAQLGLLLDALKETDMYDDTALFFLSDHGDFTGDYGLVEKTQNTFEDCLTRVPFVIKPPAGTPLRAGTRKALVELVDLCATIYDLLGYQPDHSHFGRSLLPLLAGSDTHRDAVFCQGGRLEGEPHASEREHLSKDSLYYPRMVMQQQIPAHGKATMIRTETHKYVHRLYEHDELYDLEADPMELVNLANDKGLRPLQTALKDRLMQFYLETSDVVPHRDDPRD